MIIDTKNSLSEAELSEVSGGEKFRNGPYLRYKLEFGDTLYDLAKKYNTTVSVLCSTNNISDPGWIIAGNYILIPTKP